MCSSSLVTMQPRVAIDLTFIYARLAERTCSFTVRHKHDKKSELVKSLKEGITSLLRMALKLEGIKFGDLGK